MMSDYFCRSDICDNNRPIENIEMEHTDHTLHLFTHYIGHTFGDWLVTDHSWTINQYNI